MDDSVEKVVTSYRNKGNLGRLFDKEINGICNINYLSVGLAKKSSGQLVYFTPYPKTTNEFNTQNYSLDYDVLSPEKYEQLEIYSWLDTSNTVVRENMNSLFMKHGLHNGTMLTREMGDFYILYGVSQPVEDLKQFLLMINNINKILRVCDDFYNEASNEFSHYFDCTVPSIETFSSFGGKAETDGNRDQNISYSSVLTPRENTLIPLVQQGYSIKLIAFELGISTRTAEQHISSIKRKLGHRNIKTLIAFLNQS